MDVATLIVKVEADLRGLEAGLSRAQTLTRGAAAGMKEAGAAGAEGAAAATAGQERFNAALARTTAQLQLLKGDALGSLKTAFPSVSDADLSKMTALRTEIGAVRAQLLEEAGAAKEAEKAIAAAGNEGVAAVRMQARALKEAEAEWATFAASVEKSAAISRTAMAKQAQAAKPPSVYGTLTSAPVQKLADTGLLVGGGIAALGALAVKQAGDFDTAMHDMQASARVSAAEFKQWHDGILALGKDPNVSDGPAKLAKAMYEIASLGYRGKEALDILGHAARLATGGLADTEKTVHLLDAVMKSGIGGFHGVAEASNILARAVHMGAVHVADLAEKFPQLAQTAKGAGISLQDILATYIGLTRRGIDAGHAQELLGQLLNAVLKPSKQAQGIMTELGVSYGVTGVRATGWLGVLEQMGAAMKGHADDMIRATGRIHGMQAALALTDQGGKEWKETLAGLATAQHGFGAELESSTEQMKGFGGQSKKVQADIERLGVEIGEKLLPHVRDGMAGLDRFLKKWDDLSPGKQDAIIHGAEYAAFFLIIVGGAAKALKSVTELAAGLKALAPLAARAGVGAAGVGAAGAGALTAAAIPAGYGAYDYFSSKMDAAEWMKKAKADRAAGEISQREFEALGHQFAIKHVQDSFYERSLNSVANFFGGGLPSKLGGADAAAIAALNQRKASEEAMAQQSAANLEGFKLPGGAKSGPPAAVHPGGERAGPNKELARALKEITGLQAQLNTVMKTGDTIAGQVARTYPHVTQAIRDHITHLREAVKAHGEHAAALQKARAQQAAEERATTDSLARLKAEVADLKTEYTTGGDAVAKWTLAHRHATAAQKDAFAAGEREKTELQALIRGKHDYAGALEAAQTKLADLTATMAGHSNRVADLVAKYHGITGAQATYLDGVLKQSEALEKLTKEHEAAAKALAEKHAAALKKVTDAQESFNHAMEEARARLTLLTSGDGVPKLRAQFHDLIPDSQLQKLAEMEQRIKGVGNALNLANAPKNELDKQITDALAGFAGTGKVETQETRDRKELLATLKRLSGSGYTVEAQTALANLAGSGATTEQLQRAEAQLKNGPLTAGDQDQRFAQLKNALTPEQFRLLDKVTGAPGAYFGKLGDEFKQQTDKTFSEFGDGLKRSVTHFDQVIGDIRSAALSILSPGGGSLPLPPHVYPAPPGDGPAAGDVNVHMTVVTPDAGSFVRSRSQVLSDYQRGLEYAAVRGGG